MRAWPGKRRRLENRPAPTVLAPLRVKTCSGPWEDVEPELSKGDPAAVQEGVSCPELLMGYGRGKYRRFEV